MLRKDLTKLVKRDDITPDSFEILGISLSGYTAGEAAVNARVSPLGQCLLRDVPVKSERSKTNDDLHTQHQRAASLTRPSRRSPQNLEDRSSRRSSLGRCLRPLCPRRCSSTCPGYGGLVLARQARLQRGQRGGHGSCVYCLVR